MRRRQISTRYTNNPRMTRMAPVIRFSLCSRKLHLTLSTPFLPRYIMASMTTRVTAR